jgi:transcriptional regulator with XRE-family HTH domain
MALRIKEVIKEQGTTVQELADKMGISRVGLSQHINGNPSVEVLERIASALNVQVSDLFENLPMKL